MTTSIDRPAFQIERSRNGQWTAHLVAANHQVVWVTEQFTTLSKAEESLFHLIDEALAILEQAFGAGMATSQVSEIPYLLSVAYTRGERDYEGRVAHRPPS